MVCVDSIMETQQLFQTENGGSIPTSTLQLKLFEIKHSTAFNEYVKYHYLGGGGFLASINYGVYFNGELLGAISYGIPNARNISGVYTQETQGEWLELTRLALSPLLPKNSESRVIGVSIKLLKKLNKKLKGIGLDKLLKGGIINIWKLKQKQHIMKNTKNT